MKRTCFEISCDCRRLRNYWLVPIQRLHAMCKQIRLLIYRRVAQRADMLTQDTSIERQRNIKNASLARRRTAYTVSR